MDRNNIKNKILEIVGLVTNNTTLIVDEDKDIRSQINLDSMQYVEIVARIESILNIDLPIEVLTVRTFKEFLDMIMSSEVKEYVY